MMRRVLCVGDKPDAGGYTEDNNARPFKVFGHQVAIIGGRAYCEAVQKYGCHRQGRWPSQNQPYPARNRSRWRRSLMPLCYIAAHDRAHAKHFHARRHGGINGGSHFQQDRLQRCGIRADRPLRRTDRSKMRGIVRRLPVLHSNRGWASFLGPLRSLITTPYFGAMMPLRDRKETEHAEQTYCGSNQLDTRLHQGSGTESANVPRIVGQLPIGRPVRQPGL